MIEAYRQQPNRHARRKAEAQGRSQMRAALALVRKLKRDGLSFGSPRPGDTPRDPGLSLLPEEIHNLKTGC